MPTPGQPHNPSHLTSPSPFHRTCNLPPPPPSPPSDPELVERIHKLLDYVIMKGPEYHGIVREEAENNPDFDFLFGGTEHYYYHYMLQMAVGQSYGTYVPFHSSSGQTTMQQPMNPITTQYNASPSGGASASVLGPPHHMHQPAPFPPSHDDQQPLLSFTPPGYDNYHSSNSRLTDDVDTRQRKEKRRNYQWIGRGMMIPRKVKPMMISTNLMK
ncbi:hypothetical protein DM860_008509 [Cuscuta australis]|uniref:SURP motif domain-containing protein n=1 Tax=Cuscuta australis TaxID=267555 RepID=A0A328D936_9ASTE|nr:hypothetical protein DM860_008509 [Cuscuta australis]